MDWQKPHSPDFPLLPSFHIIKHGPGSKLEAGVLELGPATVRQTEEMYDITHLSVKGPLPKEESSSFPPFSR